MTRIQIDSQTVFRIVLIAILAVAIAALAREVVSDARETFRWLAAALFLATALAPAVALVQRIRLRGHNPPRWLAILLVFVVALFALAALTLNVIPPMVSEVEEVGTEGPTYVKDLENWAENNNEFSELNQKYDLTSTLSSQTAKIPSALEGAAGELKAITVELLENLLGAVTVLVLAFFLLLEGPTLLNRFLRWLGGERERKGHRIATGVYGVVRGYVTVNVTLALAAGLFTWGVLELLGVDLAVPLAILVGILDLVPLIGLSIGGLVVAVVAALHSFPTALIVWAVAFLIFQQLQDRVVQPMLYGRAVKVNPLVAIVALLAGAQILGILGALLAIPVAASIAVVFEALRGQDDPGKEPDLVPATDPQPSPARG